MRKYLSTLIIAAVFLLLIFGGAIITLYTDWLWFKSIGFSTIFSKMLLSKIEIGILSGFLFFVLIYTNLWLARKIAPPPITSRLQQHLIQHLGKLARRGIGIIIFLGSIVVSAIVGLQASAYWQEWLMFLNPTQFGSTDPIFLKDIGFYIFQLPFLSYIYNWLFFALFISTIAVAALHFADEAIDIQIGQVRFARGVKTQLGIMIALMFFLKAFGYRLAMFDLLFAQGRLFDGASYVDLYVKIPMIWVMIALTLIGGILVLINTKQKGIKLTAYALGIVVVGSIVLTGIIPSIVQELYVKPNENEKEIPFIARAIKATQDSYGLNNVAIREFAADTTLTPQQIEDNQTTIENIRLWDKQHILDAYSQVQTIKQYYNFADIDVDRYWLTDKTTNQKKYRQVWLGAREMNQSLLPETSLTWVNQNLQYTHGYGYVMSPVNEVSLEGMPQFFVYDIPPKTTVDLPLEKMGVYFGEITKDNAFVKTDAKEFDYPRGSTSVSTSYNGSHGVSVGSFWRKLLFAFRFSDINILLNRGFTKNSEVLYYREIRERTSTLFPFLQFDKDPYLVTVNGKLYWMLDAYTTSKLYPYSKQIASETLQFNYIRNSVKLVINAYTGKVDAYVVENPLKDPIIQTYQKIFPGVFKSISQMPDEFKAHIRYPEDLFRVQAEIYKVYHMSDPRVFYNKSNLWGIPEKTELGDQGVQEPMEPYYIIMKLPNGQSEEFILMNTFTFAEKPNMASWICAKCDGKDYGKLVVYQFPPDKNVYGPAQIIARAKQDTNISEQITLWGQQGSSVSTGNLLVIPIESSLLYVLPMYLESSSTKIPELKRVIVVLGNKIAMEQTLHEALSAVVGAPIKNMGGAVVSSIKAPKGTAATEEKGIKNLVDQAVTQYDKAQEAQRNGDWSSYGKYVASLKQTLNELKAKAK